MSLRCGIVASFFSGCLAIGVSFVSAQPPKLGEETIPEGEAAATRDLGLLQLQAGIYKFPGGRAQHNKGHACVEAEFTVNADIPERFKHGVFAQPRTYKAVIRFSNGASQTDNVPDIHGMAIKLYDVTGKKLLGPADPTAEQDFILMDSPKFFAEDVAATLQFGRFAAARGQALAVAAAKSKAQGVKVEAEPVEASDLVKAILTRLGTVQKQPKTVVQTYFSAVPYKLGPANSLETAVKYEAIPTSAVVEGKATGENDLRESLEAILAKDSIEFDFAVRPQDDARAQPIENPTVEWTTTSVVLAHIKIKPQKDLLSQEAQAKCEALSFNPWRSITEHKPLGGISRARRQIYLDSANLRGTQKPKVELPAAKK